MSLWDRIKERAMCSDAVWLAREDEIAELRDRAVEDAETIATLQMRLTEKFIDEAFVKPVDWSKLTGVWWWLEKRRTAEAEAPPWLQAMADQSQAEYRSLATGYGLDLDDRRTVFVMLATVCLATDAMVRSPYQCGHVASLLISVASSIAEFVPVDERPKEEFP